MDFKEEYLDTSSTVTSAVRLSDLKLLRKLIRDGRCVDAMDNRGWRPLHQAAISKDDSTHRMLEELLKHEDTDVNWRSYEGETALLLACRHNNDPNVNKTVETLLKYRADPNIADNEDETPLLAATRSGLTAVVDILVKHESVDVSRPDYGGWTPLHEASTRGDKHMTQTLIDFGAKLDAKDECGMTPIFSAAQHGRIECLRVLVEAVLKSEMEYLLDEGANDGASPVMIAAQQGFTDCIELLIRSGADPNSFASDGVNAIHLAAECGHHKTLELLLKKMDIKQMEKELRPELQELKIRNPIHLAISHERLKCLKVLIKSGFSIESVDYLFEQKFSLAIPSPKYITPLGLSISLGHREAAKLLLRAGANPNSTHSYVYAPSHCVFSVIDNEFERGDNNYQMLQLLAEHKVDVNYCRSSEEPNELLHSFFSPSFLSLLLRYGLDISTCFKENYINRFLSLSFHLVTLHWYHNVLPVVINIVERNPVVRDHFIALAHHIESTYTVRFGIDDYNPSVWQPVFDLFERPHSLKETARFAIRRQVYEKSRQKAISFPDIIEALDLPNSLKEYLLFSEFSVNPILV